MTNALVRRSRRSLRRASQRSRAAGAAALVASAAVLSACGGTGTPAATKSQSASTASVANASTTSTSAAAEQAAGGPGGAARAAFAAPAASGTIASISGNVLEVQNTQSGQTTVDVTAKTRVTATSAVTLASVRPGDCVTASGTKGSTGGLAATSVTLLASTAGPCTAFGEGAAQGNGGLGFERSGSRSFTRPTVGAGSVPSRPANAGTVVGTVKSVSGSTIEVSGYLRSLRFGPGAATPTSTSSPTSTTTATTRLALTTIAVTVGGSTKYQKVGAATVASLKVGECATAFGSVSDIGAVTATRLAVSPATGGSCASGFGAGGGGRFFGAGFPGGGAGGRVPSAAAGTGALVNTGAAS